MSDFGLVDQVVIVTGAAGGIGQAISREFTGAGATVVLAGRTEASLSSLASELNEGRTLVVPTDITDPAAVEHLIDATMNSFGRIDVIINNAGGGSAMRKAEDTPYDEWVRLIDFNLTGTFNCCMAAGKKMIEQNAGKIINISSVAGTKGNPGMLHYSAAKAAVLSLTNNLAFMWAAHNICVNAIVPGMIATPQMIKWGIIPADTNDEGEEVPRLTRPPGPEDVAAMSRFLASPAADMITGEAIPVRAWFRPDRFWN